MQLKVAEPTSGQAMAAFCAFLKRSSGLVIGADKGYLIESRIAPIIKREKLSGLSELVAILERPGSSALCSEITQAMTINETYFFRDKAPFDAFRDHIVPAMEKRRATERRLRIWSAAASTGQEAYSLSMVLSEMGPRFANWNIEIVGTDLSEAALAKARAAKYSQFEVQRGLPTAQLLRHLTQTGDYWEVNKPIRDRVKFRHFNLLSSFDVLGRFDVIFCRNVLIYFDQAEKTSILNRMRKCLANDGFLVLGASESLIGINTEFTLDSNCKSLVYRIEQKAAK